MQDNDTTHSLFEAIGSSKRMTCEEKVRRKLERDLLVEKAVLAMVACSPEKLTYSSLDDALYTLGVGVIRRQKVISKLDREGKILIDWDYEEMNQYPYDDLEDFEY